MTRVAPGLLAIVVGAVIAVAIFVPFVAASYRLRGGLGWRRTAAWAALLVSTVAIWAYTIFPAPALTDSFTCTTPNLDLFRDVRDIVEINNQGVNPLANAALQVTILNVLLFVPTGFLVRALFNRGVVVAAAVGLLLSLGVETTQLTGLWGVYPCSYRFFSVGDLLHNTLGCILGSLLAWAVLRRGATRQEPAPRSERVTSGRRLLAMVCDVVLVAVVSIVVGFASRGALDRIDDTVGIVAGVLCYAVPTLLTGITPGESAVLLTTTSKRPAVLARPIRVLTGLGGIVLLSEFVPVLGDALAVALAIASVAWVLATKGQGSLAARAAGMTAKVAR